MLTGSRYLAIISNTETSTVYTTTSATIFSTITFTTTNSDTTTASASPAFTALGDVLTAMGDTYSRRRRRDQSNGRQDDAPAALERRSTKAKNVVWPPTTSVYPASVTCYKLAEVVSIATKTATAKSTTTVTVARSTVTKVSSPTADDYHKVALFEFGD